MTDFNRRTLGFSLVPDDNGMRVVRGVAGACVTFPDFSAPGVSSAERRRAMAAHPANGGHKRPTVSHAADVVDEVAYWHGRARRYMQNIVLAAVSALFLALLLIECVSSAGRGVALLAAGAAVFLALAGCSAWLAASVLDWRASRDFLNAERRNSTADSEASR